MTLTGATAPDRIVALLDRLLAGDPVRHTILGTLRSAVFDSGASPWAAATEDGSGVAVRSHRVFPVVVAGDWPATDRVELVRLLAGLPELAGLSGAEREVMPLVELLAGALPGRSQSLQHQRLFRLGRLVEPAGVAGSARRAITGDRALVLDWYRSFGEEAGARPADVMHAVDEALGHGGCWLWDDAAGRAVSLATRRPVVAGSARIGPVYTPPAARGHGYGSAVTAAATRDILDDGAVPVLFTDLANPVSNSIYPKLGYTPVEDRVVVLLH